MKLENALRRKAIAYNYQRGVGGSWFVFTDKRGKQWEILVDKNGNPYEARSIRIRAHNWMYRPKTPYTLPKPTPAVDVIKQVLSVARGVKA